MASFRRERAWIEKKLNSGVSAKELYHSVGAFSNKTKEKVMKQKGLSSDGYKKRYDFCFRVFSLLETNEYKGR